MSINQLTQQLAIDPSGTNAIADLARKDQKAAIKAVAGQFEALLLNQMMASMRDTSLSGEEESSELGMFRNMHDQQLVQGMVSMGGLGLADMLAKQLLQRQQGDSAADVAASGVVSADSTLSLRPTLPVGASSAAMTSELPKDKAAFVEALLPHARQAASRLGVAPEVLVAHAALESGWGQRMLKHADGRNSFNLFGIKAGASWQGDRLAATTTEFDGMTARKQVEPFRAYASYADAFDDYASLIQGSARYKPALNAGANASQYAQALQAGGYATDPAYASKLQSVVRTVVAL